MDIFSQLADIMSNKTGELLQDVDEEKEFIPFMIQRWLSMHSPEMAMLVNQTSNRHWKAIESSDKQMWYHYFLSVIPKVPNKRIPYIKKATKSQSKGIDKDKIQFIAERLEISQREVKDLIEEEGLTNVKLKKIIGE